MSNQQSIRKYLEGGLSLQPGVELPMIALAIYMQGVPQNSCFSKELGDMILEVIVNKITIKNQHWHIKQACLVT